MIAISVMEFLEKSPEYSTRSEFRAKSSKVLERAKEPDSVDSAKYNEEKVGSLPCKTSGRSRLAVLMGSEFKNSVFLMAIMQFCKLPPRMAMRPVFCSGIFQRIELSVIGCSFCQ